MATILCFGDSNTWGAKPQIISDSIALQTLRYNENERWPAILQQALTDKHKVIEEGQPSRTLVHNPCFSGNKSGVRYLDACLKQYSPALVLFMLGTNDLKKRFSLSAQEISLSMMDLAAKTLNYSPDLTPPKIKVMIICPPVINEVGHYAKIYAGGRVKSKQLNQYYQQNANKLGCDFFDAGSVVTSSVEDGVHWHREQHKRLAKALLPQIMQITLI
jgi:lysophospholipase L1-like esterase